MLFVISVAPARALDYFPLEQVRLLDGPFKLAQDRNIDYVLALDADRLLAPFLVEAGLESDAKPYGNWESSGLNGHMGGHYLSALSLAWAATGRQDVGERLDYMLKQMRRAQLAQRTGYLGGIPGGKTLWAEIGSGNIKADLFSLNDAWVPWYNLHKTFAGLRDAWLLAERQEARQMLVDLSDWTLTLLGDLTDEQLQTMLITEPGGMNEVLAQVADITGDTRYLDLARRLSHHALLDPLLKGQDRLNGLHANTQIPKVIGFEEVARLTDNAAWHQAADFFWQTVVNERSVAIGGNSVREHFHDKLDFSSMVDDVEGPETCNTYNMLKLTRQLYRREQNVDYVAYYERALYNHILSSQDPQSGGLVYFSPMRPQHYRVYSRTDDAMWCCVGSGIENHMKYGEFIYAKQDDTLWVNLFIASELTWPEKKLSLRQETSFPDQSSTRLVFQSDANLTLKLRFPAWAANKTARVKINGVAQPVTVTPGQYVTLKGEWKAGDEVTLALPMQLHLEPLPDKSDYFAILFGPIVLAAKTDPFPGETLSFFGDDSRMGHIASGDVCPTDRIPVFVTEKADITPYIARHRSRELEFDILPGAGLTSVEEYRLIPFFRVHRSRYMVYWPHSTPQKLQQRQARAAVEDRRLQRLTELTLDKIAPGEQQPEVEHNFSGEKTIAGVNFGRHWRHAEDWFGYTLSDPEGEGNFLRIDYWGADSGRRFRIEFNGIVIARVTSTGERGADFYSMDYPLPEEALRAANEGTHRLRFVADEGSVAGGIYGVRLLKDLP